MAAPTATIIRNFLEGYGITTGVLTDAKIEDIRDNEIIPHVEDITGLTFDGETEVTRDFTAVVRDCSRVFWLFDLWRENAGRPDSSIERGRSGASVLSLPSVRGGCAVCKPVATLRRKVGNYPGWTTDECLSFLRCAR